MTAMRGECYRPGMLYRARSTSLVLAALLVAGASQAASPAAPARTAERVSVAQDFASVGGLWCGAGLLHEFSLEIVQQYERVTGKLVRKNRVRHITGHVEGSLVKTDPLRDHTMELRAQGDQLRIVGATGVLAMATGQSFERATSGSCSR